MKSKPWTAAVQAEYMKFVEKSHKIANTAAKKLLSDCGRDPYTIPFNEFLNIEETLGEMYRHGVIDCLAGNHAVEEGSTKQEMRAIWKFEVKIEDRFEIEMPKDAKLLQVQVQNVTPVLWAIVAPDQKTERRAFRVFGTGHTLGALASDALTYIGTFQLGAFVGHLFEEQP